MPRTIKITSPIRLAPFTHVMRIDRVDVYLHWSTLVIGALMLIGAYQRPLRTLIGGACYLSVFMIHECGHMIAAQRKGCYVESIKVYPICAVTCFQTPWSRLDHCIIAWGGVLAQAVVALPLVLWVGAFGYSPFEELNIVFAILGFYSLLIAAFNLLPLAPLDGAVAWGLVPELIKRARRRQSRPRPRW